MAPEHVVVDDDPACSGRDPLRARAFDDVHGVVRGDQGDLARPVALDRRRADDEPLPLGRGVAERGDRLPRLAEPHVIGEDGARPAEEKRYPLDLMREQAFGQCRGLAERDLRVVGG